MRACTDPSQNQPRSCDGCGATVPHKMLKVAVDGEEVVVWVATKAHKAPCGLRCARDGSAHSPQHGEHGFKGKCPLCSSV